MSVGLDMNSNGINSPIIILKALIAASFIKLMRSDGRFSITSKGAGVNAVTLVSTVAH